MRAFALRVGRVGGIEVRLHASVLVVAALVAWILAESALPSLAPGYTTAAYWIAGTLTGLLFLSSLLAHELSHSLVARHRNVRVRDITLWLLGGIATIEDEPENPNDELAIAIAGPLASIGIGVVALAAGSAAAMLLAPPLLVGALTWLGSINVMLAVFNLVPAAPLDGGRVLRAWLWRRHGDRARATRAAARAGETFGRILVVVGVVEALLGLAVSGIWAVLLGWFLLEAARAEGAQADIEQQLEGVRVGDVMTRDPVTVPATITVDELLDEYVTRHRCSSFPVVDDGRVVGLATLARCRAVAPRRHAGVTVRDVAWPLDAVPIAAPEESLTKVLPRVTGGDGRILVFDQDRLAGIVSPSDVARVLESRPVLEPDRRAA